MEPHSEPMRRGRARQWQTSVAMAVGGVREAVGELDGKAHGGDW